MDFAKRPIFMLLALGALWLTACGTADDSPIAAPADSTTIPADSTSTSTTTTQVAVADAVLTSYEFPSGLVDGRPTQVQGLLGIPEGPGPFPLAIVMHGSHPPCVDDFDPSIYSDAIVTETVPSLCGEAFPEYIRNDIGLGYIVSALNEAGIAAVSIDVEATFVWWGGEPNELNTIGTIATTHLEALTRLNDGEDLGLGIDPITGRLDLTQISVVGHSTAGGHVASFIDASRELPFEPVAAVMIEPAITAEVQDYLDVPSLLIRGECDEDVGPEAGRGFLQQTVSLERASRVVDMFVPTAGHRNLTTNLNGSLCPDQGDRTATQNQVGQAVASFVTTQGEEIVSINDVQPSIESLIGPPPTIVPSDGMVDFDPQSIPLTSSEIELLAPLADGADFSDALIEDF